MEMTGESRSAAARERVWAAPTYPELLNGPIPRTPSLGNAAGPDMATRPGAELLRRVLPG